MNLLDYGMSRKCFMGSFHFRYIIFSDMQLKDADLFLTSWKLEFIFRIKFIQS